MKINDAVFGALFLLLGVMVLVHVQGFPKIPGQPVGPALFPGLVAAGLAVCGILLEQGYQIPGAKQKIALLYGKDADFTAVLSKAAALRDTYNVTVLPQGKKLGKQLGQLEAAGFAGAAFMDKDEVKVFAAQ